MKLPNLALVHPEIDVHLPSITSITANKVLLLHLKHSAGTNWEYGTNLTSMYLDMLPEIAHFWDNL
jgi:hypothetical protein